MAKRPRAKAPAKKPPARSKGITPAIQQVYDFVCKLALEFPSVELVTSYGTPGIKAKGKVMARLRAEAEGGLALKCDFVDRQMLMQAAPETFYVTDHYLDWPMVLINLTEVRRDALPDLVERAWRMTVPAKLAAAYDADKRKGKKGE